MSNGHLHGTIEDTLKRRLDATSPRAKSAVLHTIRDVLPFLRSPDRRKASDFVEGKAREIETSSGSAAAIATTVRNVITEPPMRKEISAKTQKEYEKIKRYLEILRQINSLADNTPPGCLFTLTFMDRQLRIIVQDLPGIEHGRGIKQGAYFYLVKKEDYDDRPQLETGWKLHLSFVDYQHTIRAWKIIEPILVKYRVYMSKVRKPVEEGNYQPGKDVVIYTSSSRPTLPWNDLLQEIETALRTASPSIIEGPNPRYRFGERITDIREPQIPGSRYFYAERDDLSRIEDIDPRDLGPFSDIRINAERGAAARGGAGGAAHEDRAP